MLGIIYLWLAVVNAWAIFLMFADKNRAIRKQWRIPESIFYMLAFLGGWLGIELSMIGFHHKTRKTRFSQRIHFSALIWLASSLIILYFVIS